MTIALRQRPLARVVAGIVRANDGAIFDASDMSTMFQDAAGTTPVTVVEQPVGLMLDKSRGMMLGPELVSNGTFDDLSSWGLGTGWSISSGKLYAANVATGTNCRQVWVSGDSTGKVYAITISIPEITAGTIRVQLEGAFGGRYLSAGMFTCYVKSPTASPRIFIQATAITSAVIESISVKELYGYHATQPITASQPTLSARKNLLVATETLAMQSVTTLAATYTLSFTGTGAVTLSGTATGTLTGTGTDRVSLTFAPTAGKLTLTVSGSVTKAQLELGAVAGQYQIVTTATDYDTDERYFPKYLRFDGIDDCMNLPFMNLYGGGSASIVCARDAVSQTTDTYIISERSTTDADPKYFPSRQLANAGNMDTFITDDTGAVALDTAGSPFSGVANAVIRSIVDSGSNLKLFKNGTLAANDNYTRSGTLTLNNTTIGASVSTTTSNYASMKLYGLIVTKSALTDAQRVACERYLGRKSGVPL